MGNKGNRNKFHIPNLKKPNIKNFPNYIKFKENKKKQVQFNQNHTKNKINKIPKIPDVFSKRNNHSSIKSYQNSSKVINSNGLKSTNITSNYENSKNENLEKNYLVNNKRNTHTFNNETKEYRINKTLKNLNLYYKKKKKKKKKKKNKINKKIYEITE